MATLAPSVVNAANFNDLDPCTVYGIGSDACPTVPKEDTGSVKSLITDIIRYLLIGVGILAVIMIIVSGIRMATSGGNPETVKNAKNTLLWAVIGLILALLASAVVNLVVSFSNKI
jgi:type IV secretory pathway VirB2 component (pilin)